MKIKLDDVYTLNSDQHCYWITEQRVSQDGKPYEKIVTGYHREFEQVVDSFIGARIRGLDVTKLSKVSQEIRDLKRMVKKWTDNLSLPNEKE
jgi:hypothetical protein